jgi:hypothetical protein
VFDNEHDGASVVAAGRTTGSKHYAVLDAHAGEKSITIALENTPEVRALILTWLAEAEVSSEEALVFIARNADNAPRRLVLQVAAKKAA